MQCDYQLQFEVARCECAHVEPACHLWSHIHIHNSSCLTSQIRDGRPDSFWMTHLSDAPCCPLARIALLKEDKENPGGQLPPRAMHTLHGEAALGETFQIPAMPDCMAAQQILPIGN